MTCSLFSVLLLTSTHSTFSCSVSDEIYKAVSLLNSYFDSLVCAVYLI